MVAKSRRTISLDLKTMWDIEIEALLQLLLGRGERGGENNKLMLDEEIAIEVPYLIFTS